MPLLREILPLGGRGGLLTAAICLGPLVVRVDGLCSFPEAVVFPPPPSWLMRTDRRPTEAGVLVGDGGIALLLVGVSGPELA